MNKTQDKSQLFLQDHKRQKGEDYQEIQKLYRMCEKNKPSKILKGFYIKFKNEDFSKQNLQSLIQEVSKRYEKNSKLLNEQDVDEDADQRLLNFIKVYQEKQFDDSKSYPNSRRNHFYFIKQLIIEEMNYKEIKILVNQENNLKTIKSIKLPQVKTNNYEVQDLTKAKVNKVEKKIYNALKEFEPKKQKRVRPVVKVRKPKSKSPKKYNSNLSFQDNNAMLEDQVTNKGNNDQSNKNDNLLDPFDTQQTMKKKQASQKRFDLNKDEYDYALETDANNPKELIKEVKIRNSIKDNLFRNSCDMSQAFKQKDQPAFDPNQSFGENSKRIIDLEDNMSDNLEALDKNVLAVDRKLANVQEHEDSVKKQYGNDNDEDSQKQFDDNSFNDDVSNDQLKQEIDQNQHGTNLKEDSLVEKPITANASVTSEDQPKSNDSLKQFQLQRQKTPYLISDNEEQKQDTSQIQKEEQNLQTQEDSMKQEIEVDNKSNDNVFEKKDETENDQINKESLQQEEAQNDNNSQQNLDNEQQNVEKDENKNEQKNHQEEGSENQNISPNQSFDNNRMKSPTFMGSQTDFQDQDSNNKQNQQANQKQDIEDNLSEVNNDENSKENVFLNDNDSNQEKQEQQYFLVDSDNQVQTLTPHQQEALNNEVGFPVNEKDNNQQKI